MSEDYDNNGNCPRCQGLIGLITLMDGALRCCAVYCINCGRYGFQKDKKRDTGFADKAKYVWFSCRKCKEKTKIPPTTINRRYCQKCRKRYPAKVEVHEEAIKRIEAKGGNLRRKSKRVHRAKNKK